ncbi:MAG TPA: PEP-CTERM sorting domain-containing protein [Nitrosomonas halophila]|nr:PEP-CTERM sorting domain-containing protein [Nitrosomonas halophila]
MTFTDKVDTGPDYRLIAFGSNLSYSFTHNIITGQDEGTQSYFRSGSYGFNPLTDLISSISLSLRFKDESDDIAPESVQFIFNGQSFGTQTITSGGTIYTAAFLSELDTFLNDGILNVTLQNAGITNGPQEGRSDFLFIDSTLTVEVERGVQSARQIPEPATLALIGLCLVGLVYSRCKRV